MAPHHPENFDSDSALPITDEYVDEVLNDEFGIPDGIEDVTPRVEAARKILALARGLDHASDESFPAFLLQLLTMIRDDEGNLDLDLTLEVTYRLARMVEGLLAFSRDMCTDDDDENCTGARDFDEMFFGMLEREVDSLMGDKFTPYWDSARMRRSEGVIATDDGEEIVRTFRFSYTCDVDCDSEEFALVELADSVSKMLEPTSTANTWTMTEFSEVVPLDEPGEVVSTRHVHLGKNSARLKGFLGLMEQTNFVFEETK